MTRASTSRGWKNNWGEEAAPWLDVDNLRHAAAANDDADVRGGHTVGRNRLDVVLERGQLLLYLSGEQHDWDIDDKVREYIREPEALQNLDATVIVGCAVSDDLTMGILQQQQQEESFLTRRVALQRLILARRLGLGGILNAPILVDGHHGRAPKKGIGSPSGIKKRSRIIDNSVDDEDLAHVVNISLSIS
jgi:hypothetical protein